MKKIFTAFVSILLCCVFILNVPVMAYSDFYANNDILFYDSNATSDCDSSSSVGTTSQVFGTTAAEKVWNGLRSLGFTDEQTAGLMGNLQSESAFSPIRLENGTDMVIGVKGGYGLAQWTSSGRRKGFIQALIDHGFSQYTNPDNSSDEIYHKVGQTLLDEHLIDTDFDGLIAVSLDFLAFELNGTYKEGVVDPLNSSSYSTVITEAEYSSNGATNYAVAQDSEIVWSKFEIPGAYSDMMSALKIQRGDITLAEFNAKRAANGKSQWTEADIPKYIAAGKESGTSRASSSQIWYDKFSNGAAAGSGDPCTQDTPASSSVVGDIGEPSDNIACDPRTIDLGVHTGHVAGKAVQIRACLVPNITSNNPAAYDSEGRSNVMVNSRVSGAFYQMAEDAAATGNILTAGSSIRTYEQQLGIAKENCGGDGTQGCALAAGAGNSAHEAGLAIDFSQLCGKGLDKPCDDKFYPWLKANAAKYKIAQYNAEYWHFSARSFVNDGKSG